MVNLLSRLDGLKVDGTRASHVFEASIERKENKTVAVISSGIVLKKEREIQHRRGRFKDREYRNRTPFKYYRKHGISVGTLFIESWYTYT